MQKDSTDSLPADIMKDLLLSWSKLAGLHHKTTSENTQDLQTLSNVAEKRTAELTDTFQKLFHNSQDQSKRMEELTILARSIKIDDRTVEFKEVAATLQETFLNSISSILDMSKQAVIMVYSIDDALKTLSHIEKSINAIETINHKTKYLSLNATIEAVRAGSAGESFQVVANEVRELSNDTQQLATNIRSQVTNMSDILMESQQLLQEVARIDMSENILAKDQMDQMMMCLVDNSNRMMEIMDVAKKSNADFSKTASELIRGAQFQDRFKQDMDRIVNEISETSKSFTDVQRETCDYLDIPMEYPEESKNANTENSSEKKPDSEDSDDIKISNRSLLANEAKSSEEDVTLF